MIDNAVKAPSREFADRTAMLGDPVLLRTTAEEDGYLFFRGLLPRERVLGLRRQILDILRSRGLLAPDRDPMEGAADPPRVAALDLQGRADVGVSNDIYREIQKLQEFHAIAHDPALYRVFSLLFDEEPMPHPRHIGRIMLPHPQVRPTPPHQDYLHIQGTPETWTCWFPLGDCPRELGGLAVLHGSHKLGLLRVTGNAGAGGLETLLCGYDLEWAYGDYEAGDVIVFHSYLVHRSMPNRIKDRIRMSCDYRYQPVGAEIEARSLLPHGDYTWEELYEGWEDEELKYYWKKHSFTLSPWDESIRWQKEKIC